MEKKIRLEVYPSERLLAALDRWRKAQPELPTRAYAIRYLLAEILSHKLREPKEHTNAI